MRERVEILTRLADEALIRSKRVDDGLELQFTACRETRRSLEHVIELERDCCSFLEFSLDPGADDADVLIVHVRASGAEELLDALHLAATQREAVRRGASAFSST